MSLGFIIARFSLRIRELSLQVKPQLPPRRVGLSVPLGEWMIGIGAVLTLFAAWRYRVVNRAIQCGEIEADERMVIAVTVVVIAAAVITYMIVSAKPGLLCFGRA